MEFLPSNIALIVFAIPMVAALVCSFFRLDVLAAQPKKPQRRKLQLIHADRNGQILYLDPDGTAYGQE